MGLHYGTHSIIHLSSSADLTGYTYHHVYAGAGATPTINGTAVTMAAGSTIDIKVKSISSTADVYVIGSPINVANGSPNLGTDQILG
jgi:hypothetical protein